MSESDRDLILILAIPSLVSIFAAYYAYTDFSSNGIRSPELEIGTFLFAFFAFVLAYFISMTSYMWRL